MIRGLMNDRNEAVLRLRVKGPGGLETEVELIIDTGFTSSLTLPQGLVTSLGLVRTSGGTAILADGSVSQYQMYAAEVEWDTTWRKVLVSTIGDQALLGMHMLAGYRLTMEVRENGIVEIVPL